MAHLKVIIVVDDCIKNSYKDDLFDSPYEEYHNRQLKKKCTYKNGKLDDLYVEYHPDGELQKRQLYINSVLATKNNINITRTS